MKKLSILLCGLLLLPLALQAQNVSEEQEGTDEEVSELGQEPRVDYLEPATGKKLSPILVKALKYVMTKQAISQDNLFLFASTAPYTELNFQDESGKTILHYAVEQNRTDMVAFLFMPISEDKEEQAEKMCKLYQKLAIKGMAPNECKHYKAYLESGKEDMRKYIDVTLRDNEGKTALDYATSDEMRALFADK